MLETISEHPFIFFECTFPGPLHVFRNRIGTNQAEHEVIRAEPKGWIACKHTRENAEKHNGKGIYDKPMAQ